MRELLVEYSSLNEDNNRLYERIVHMLETTTDPTSDETAPPEVQNTIQERNSVFLNTDLGPIGRTVSTKYEPNTSNKFHFWVGNNDEVRGFIEIGNIIAAISDDGN